jgi:hypothetical protein
VQDRTFSRRQALRAGAFTLAGGATLLVGTSAAHAQSTEKERATWLLSPTGGGRSCGPRKFKANAKDEKAIQAGGCPACNACKHHAANKIFSSPKAADAHRSHKGCLCTIVDGPVFASAVFDSLFVDSDMCDRRDPRVADIIGGGTVDPIPVPMIAGIAAPVVLVAAGGIGYAIWRRNQHRLEAATVTAPVESSDRD